MKSPALLCSMFQMHPVLAAVPFWTFPWYVHLQYELHHELPARVLELRFRSLLAESSKRSCLAPDKIRVALPTDSCGCALPLPLPNFVYFSTEGSVTSVHNQLASRKDFDFPFTCQVALTCKAARIGKKKKKPRVVISLMLGLLAYAAMFHAVTMLKKLTSVPVAVRIREVNNEQEENV